MSFLLLTFAVAQESDGLLLTTAAQVRLLSEEEASQAVRVRLTGVYMGEADPVGIAFVLQDQTEGIYIQGPPEQVRPLKRGDQLEVEGLSDPGGFAPFVIAQSVRKVGTVEVPKPNSVSLDELNSGQMDAKWVEFRGVVRSVEPKLPGDMAGLPPGTRYSVPEDANEEVRVEKMKLKLASGSTRLMVDVSEQLDPRKYLDAEVRIRGLCFNLHNSKRQYLRPFVQVPKGVEIEILKSPPENPMGVPPKSIANLLRFEQLNRKQGHRIHVRGIVVHSRPGEEFWVREGSDSLKVETAQVAALNPGDLVDVLGFPELGDYSPVLEDAVFSVLSESYSQPLPVALEEVADALRYDSNLVKLEAKLNEVRRFPDSADLYLDWHGKSVRARMDLDDSEGIPSSWMPGSFVRVAGVCSVVANEPGPLGGLWEPRTFELLLRSPGDLLVLKPPPWWNAERIAWLLLGFLAFSMLSIAVVMYVSRKRLKDQELRRQTAEAEFSAMLKERNRVAREIHDTLSQNLGAISMQLELTRTYAGNIEENARFHLGTAHKLARGALAEARKSIWNMRSQVLEKVDLADALEDILKQFTVGTELESEFRLEGARRRLSPMVENNLLRIGQEAITNACTHAKPTRIRLHLVFERRLVKLTVEDDGVGFRQELEPQAERKSFGLVGIRERVELLGGKVEISSELGKGTRIFVEVVA